MVTPGTSPIPEELEAAQNNIRLHWEPVLQLLNIQKGNRDEGVTINSVETFLNVTASSLNGMRKEQLMSMLTSVGR